MSDHPTDFQGDVCAALRDAIAAKIPGARVEATGGGGHYTLDVVALDFEGMTMLASQRLVYGAIAHLMSGARPAVHAVDKLTTRAR